MRRTQKILSVILAILMVLSIVPITASAAVTSGTCGDNLIWTYNTTTFTLTISGTGDMYDWDADKTPAPWNFYRSDILTVIIEDGVAKLPDRSAFAGSVATTDRLFRVMVKEAELPITEVSKMASLTPAKVLGLTSKVSNGILTSEAKVNFQICYKPFRVTEYA